MNINKQQGFTLLEILLVLFLLGLMASSTLLLTEGVEDQAKYDETKHRLAQIRTAIIGDTSRTINGRPEISGFASDMGRLPNCLRELLTARLCDDSADLALWGQDVDSQVWAGWRGPYLTGNTEISGETHFRDGYGNVGDNSLNPINDWQNSGWTFFIVDNVELIVISDGFDVNDNADDVPAPNAVQQLVFATDYQVGLGADWRSINVQFSSNASGSIIAQNSLRLKLNSPDNGEILSYASPSELDSSDKRDASVFTSNRFPASDLYIPPITGVINVANNHSITFSTAVTLSSTTTVDVPATTIMTYSNGTKSGDFSCSQGCTLIIPVSSRTFLPLTPPAPPTITKINFSGNEVVTYPPQVPTIQVVPNFAKRTITVPLGSSLPPASNILTLPSGTTITFTVTPPEANPVLNPTTSRVVFDGAEMTVNGAFSRDGGTITITSSSEIITIPSNTPPDVGSKFLIPVLSVFNSGVKSLTVVCDLVADPQLGNLFDGDCTHGGTNNNISSPINLTLLPKNTLPLNDEAIEWVLP